MRAQYILIAGTSLLTTAMFWIVVEPKSVVEIKLICALIGTALMIYSLWPRRKEADPKIRL